MGSRAKGRTGKRPLVVWSLLPWSHYWNPNLGSIDIVSWPLESDGHRRSSREGSMMGGRWTRAPTLGTYSQSIIENVLR